MESTLATRIESAFDAAEAVELEASQIECRICQIAGADRLLPRRQYGKPVSTASINANLTLSALINRADPKLAAYLGIQNGQAQAQAAAAEARKAAAERMATATAELQQKNQQAAAIRQKAAISGINPLTGRRYGI
jgi:hypothetical protein